MTNHIKFDYPSSENDITELGHTSPVNGRAVLTNIEESFEKHL